MKDNCERPPEVVTSVEGVSTVRDKDETPEVVTSVEGVSTVKDTDQTDLARSSSPREV